MNGLGTRALHRSASRTSRQLVSEQFHVTEGLGTGRSPDEKQCSSMMDWELASTLHLLTCPALGDRLLPYVHVTDRRVDWEAIGDLWPRLSTGEQIMVDAASICWTGRGALDMGAAIRLLDATHWVWLVEGLNIRRGISVADQQAAV